MSELTLPVDLKSPDGALVGRIVMGGAETKNGATVATLVLFDGDIINVRNVQGGTPDNANLDLGAGSDTDRGNIVLNFDVGNGTGIFDGRKRRRFSVNWNNDNVIHSYLPHRFHEGAMVPNGVGGWRRL